MARHIDIFILKILRREKRATAEKGPEIAERRVNRSHAPFTCDR